MIQVKSLKRDSKNPAQLLRDVDIEFPEANAMIVMVLLDDNSVHIRNANADTAKASWMREVLSATIRKGVDR